MAFQRPRIGQLRRRVDLLSETQAPAGSDSIAPTFTVLASKVAARIEPIAGGRYLDDRQVETRATHTITVRYRNDWRSIEIIEYDGRRFQVRSVTIPDEGKRWLEILAEELRKV